MDPATRTFGAYVVLSPAGRGGTSEVFRARDPATGRTVALKVASSKPGAAAAIRREAHALRSLSHSGIVDFVADGTANDGTPFLVTEWLEGESLLARLRRGALTVDEALACARSLAAVLEHIHAGGWVHRDLKPGNVMLENGDVARPKLVDFGFACRAQEDVLDVNWTEEALGTPAYMAPEQARGDVAPDPRADVYGFGALLYRCLAGRAPFAGKDAVETLTKVLFEEPTPLRELAKDVPPPVASFVARAMRKDPSRRPKDGAALASLLRMIDAPPGPPSIAAMPIPRAVACVVLCHLPPVSAPEDALSSWAKRVHLARDLATKAGAELRLLGEGNVALFFDDFVSAITTPSAELARRATSAATELGRSIEGSSVGVAYAQGESALSTPALVEAARALVSGSGPGPFLDPLVASLTRDT